jgi:hypothetical protein
MSGQYAPYYPEGVYTGKVLEAGLGTAGTGTAQVVIRIQVLSEDGAFEQYSRTLFLPATEKAMPYLVDKLERLGFQGTSLREVGSLAGAEGEFYCKHQDGKERWDVSNGRASGNALELTAPDPAEMRKLDALFGKAKKGKPTQAVAQQKPPARTAEKLSSEDLGITDDDIPF